MAKSDNTQVTQESGMDFLLRMRSKTKYNVEGFGEFSTSDFIFLSTPCSYSKTSAVSNLISQCILPQKCGGLERLILLLDLVSFYGVLFYAYCCLARLYNNMLI